MQSEFLLLMHWSSVQYHDMLACTSVRYCYLHVTTLVSKNWFFETFRLSAPHFGPMSKSLLGAQLSCENETDNWQLIQHEAYQIYHDLSMLFTNSLSKATTAMLLWLWLPGSFAGRSICETDRVGISSKTVPAAATIAGEEKTMTLPAGPLTRPDKVGSIPNLRPICLEAVEVWMGDLMECVVPSVGSLQEVMNLRMCEVLQLRTPIELYIRFNYGSLGGNALDVGIGTALSGHRTSLPSSSRWFSPLLLWHWRELDVGL